jgi:hypothetical protein
MNLNDMLNSPVIIGPLCQFKANAISWAIRNKAEYILAPITIYLMLFSFWHTISLLVILCLIYFRITEAREVDHSGILWYSIVFIAFIKAPLDYWFLGMGGGLSLSTGMLWLMKR